MDLGTLEDASANYAARYVTKKLTRSDDPRLFGRDPEFSRQSNRAGGIGIGMMDFVAEGLRRSGRDKSESDVPVTLTHGRKDKPLGRYLRRQLRKKLGKEENAPQETLARFALEMRSLQEMARQRPQSLRQVAAEINKPKVARIEARERIFKQKDKL